VASLAEFYRVRGIQLAGQTNTLEAARAFTNALVNIELELQLLESDRRDTLPVFEVPDTLMQKAQVEIAIGSHAAAVATLSQLLQLQPKNATALLNRALSEIQLKQFRAAENDLKTLRKVLPEEPFVSEFGLADLANAERNRTGEIDHLKRCIKTAPETSNEYQRATNRLAALEHK